MGRLGIGLKRGPTVYRLGGICEAVRGNKRVQVTGDLVAVSRSRLKKRILSVHVIVKDLATCIDK